MLACLVSEAHPQQSARAVWNARIAADDVGRRLVVADTGAQRPLVIQVIVATHAVHERVLVLLRQSDEFIAVGGQHQVVEAGPLGPFDGGGQVNLLLKSCTQSRLANAGVFSTALALSPSTLSEGRPLFGNSAGPSTIRFMPAALPYNL